MQVLKDLNLESKLMKEILTFLHKCVRVKVVHGIWIYNVEITSLRGAIVDHVGIGRGRSETSLVQFQGTDYS